MDICARCGLQAQPGQPSCPRCGMPLRGPPPFPPQYGTPGPPGRGGPPRDGRRPERVSRDGQPRWMAAAAIVLVAVAAGAVVALILVRSPAGHTSTSPASTAATSPVQTATGEVAASQPGASQPATGTASEQTAAQSLSRLLTQSISDRSAILSAYHDVDTCGSGLVADAQTFQQAATSRQNLLSRLGALPG